MLSLLALCLPSKLELPGERLQPRSVRMWPDGEAAPCDRGLGECESEALLDEDGLSVSDVPFHLT